MTFRVRVINSPERFRGHQDLKEFVPWKIPGVTGYADKCMQTGNYHPGAKFSMLPSFANIVPLELSRVHLSTNVQGCSCHSGGVEGWPNLFPVWPFAGHSLPSPVPYTRSSGLGH